MLFDFGMFLFHNAEALAAAGTGPYFYLPKMQSHLEARLWNDVFLHAQTALKIPIGTIKATVLIETLPAAFEMDEILFELKDHIAGLNCGRWDYIFSSIKTLRNDPSFVLPDRGQVTMEAPFLRSYVAAAHQDLPPPRRLRDGRHGGADSDQGRSGRRTRARWRRSAPTSCARSAKATTAPGSRIPALVALAKQVFDEGMPGPNQLDRLRDEVSVDAAALLEPPAGTRTEAGLRHNIRVGIQYLEAWLGGQGAVPIYNLMEDAATAEISRTQIWQWLKHRAALDDGRTVTRELVDTLVAEEFVRVREEVGASRFERGRFDDARALFVQVATSARAAGVPHAAGLRASGGEHVEQLRHEYPVSTVDAGRSHRPHTRRHGRHHSSRAERQGHLRVAARAGSGRRGAAGRCRRQPRRSRRHVAAPTGCR